MHEGVPDHLDPLLRRWIYAALAGGGAEMVALTLEIRIDYEIVHGDAALFLARDPQQHELLGIVNVILSRGGPWPTPARGDRPGRNSNAAGQAQLREDLIQMLAAGSSAWQVNSDGTGLARRVDATATEAFTEAGRAASAASAVGRAPPSREAAGFGETRRLARAGRAFDPRRPSSAPCNVKLSAR